MRVYLYAGPMTHALTSNQGCYDQVSVSFIGSLPKYQHNNMDTD